MFLDDFLYMHLHIIGSSVRGVSGSMHLLVKILNDSEIGMMIHNTAFNLFLLLKQLQFVPKNKVRI